MSCVSSTIFSLFLFLCFREVWMLLFHRISIKFFFNVFFRRKSNNRHIWNCTITWFCFSNRNLKQLIWFFILNIFSCVFKIKWRFRPPHNKSVKKSENKKDIFFSANPSIDYCKKKKLFSLDYSFLDSAIFVFLILFVLMKWIKSLFLSNFFFLPKRYHRKLRNRPTWVIYCSTFETQLRRTAELSVEKLQANFVGE